LDEGKGQISIYAYFFLPFHPKGFLFESLRILL
jgi:hypothetical protein